MYTPCVYHKESMSLDITPNPNSSSRLLLILLDPKSFQTALDYITRLPGHVLSIRCRLIITILIYVWLILTLAKVCPHPCAITSLLSRLQQDVLSTTLLSIANLLLLRSNSGLLDLSPYLTCSYCSYCPYTPLFFLGP